MKEITETVIAINPGLANLYTATEYNGTLTNYYEFIVRNQELIKLKNKLHARINY